MIIVKVPNVNPRLKPWTPGLENRLAIWVLLLSSCVVIWATRPVWQYQNLNDDSFITLTYAKNLAAGKGFVYNYPPATLGTTTPLFTFLTAAVALLLPFLTVVEAAILLSVAAWLGTAWVLYLMMRHLDFQPLPAAIAASVPLLVMQAWVGFIGMEIWLFQFWLVLSIYLCLKNKSFYAGLCVGALFLTRGEGVLVGGILFGYLWLNQRKLPIQFVLGAVGLAASWIIYAMIVFGTFIPNTLMAKQAQAQLPYGRNFMVRMMSELLPGYLSQFTFFKVWLLNPYLILAALGLAYIVYRRRTLLVFVAWGIAYLVGYTALNPSAYYWYMLHIVFILQVLAGVGLAGLLTIRRTLPSPSLKALTGVVTTVLAISLLYFSLSFISRLPNFTGDHRAPVYRALSEWLRENSRPENSVAFIEIGYLGYFTDNRIVDLAGLTDPIITEHMVADGFSWGFRHYRPDYYIYAEEFDWALGEVKPALDAYTLVHQIERSAPPTPIYIYKRKDS